MWFRIVTEIGVSFAKYIVVKYHQCTKGRILTSRRVRNDAMIDFQTSD